MGYPRPDAETRYLEKQLGNRWQRVLSNGQIFNWFADFAAHESKIERGKLVKRLRVFSSRDETPTTFWVLLVNKFYAEGAHLGLRKFVEQGVTYYCPPQYFMDFKTLCQSAPSYDSTVSWELRQDYLSGSVLAYVFSPGKNEYFRPNWPEILELQGKRFSVNYYPAGTVQGLLDGTEEDDSEACLDAYRSTHSLLCLMFGKKSPAAIDIYLGQNASESILNVLKNPYLDVSNVGFNQAALEIAALCVEGGAGLENSACWAAVSDVLSTLKRDYPQLERGIVEDADYMYLMTYPLMPLNKKGIYASVMADFEFAMKAVVIKHAEEIVTFANCLTEEDRSLPLNFDRDMPNSRRRYSVETVRQYLANVRTREAMALEAFDAILELSDSIDRNSSEIVHVATLKEIVRDRTNTLTELIEATGEFLVTAPLMVALEEVGHVRNPSETTDYEELMYRTTSERPWLLAFVKFAGETDNLEMYRNEFLAYCRITTGK